MNPHWKLTVMWCSEVGEAPSLGKFFADNVSPAYISHSELQGARAIDADHWQPGLSKIVADEIRDRVQEAKMVDSGQDSKPVFVAKIANEVVGLGMVSFFPTAQEPYAILEDIVVDQNRRAFGIGKQLLDWVEDQVRSVGGKQLFLESGLHNHHAHEFFKKEGFSTCSVVMVKPIPAIGHIQPKTTAQEHSRGPCLVHDDQAPFIGQLWLPWRSTTSRMLKKPSSGVLAVLRGSESTDSPLRVLRPC